MPREKKRARRVQYLIWFAILFPLFLYVISFWPDISRTLSYIGDVFFWMLFGRDQPIPLPASEVLRSIKEVIFTVIVGFLIPFFTWLMLMAMQALLPVESLDEIIQTFFNQIYYILRSHGPAIFVQDGKMDFTSEELIRSGPGVIVVNFNSALVLETMVGQPGCLMMPTVLLHRLISSFSKSTPTPPSRVCGPGIVFTNPSERIRAVVDLRKQSRGRAKIGAYTRDGIEVISNVYAVFTIGQRPDIVELTYIGERKPENLRVISTRVIGPNLVSVALQEDELNPKDLAEAHAYARIPNQQHDAQEYTEVAPPRQEPEFNEKRVFNAVYAQARNPQEQVVPWTELPAQVTADLYRRQLSLINYDDFYQLGVEDPNAAAFPMLEIKKHFRSKLRNTGLLSFRIVFHRSMMPLVNGTYYASDLFISPSLPFTGSQVLRDRGIKMLAAGFSNPLPVSPEIYQQRLASWRVSWSQDTEIKRSQFELEAMRIRNHARAQAQRDMTAALAQIFNRGGASDEAMALRVLQALETAATDPKTRQLLPSETITLMNHLHNWLLPGPVAGQPASGLMQAPGSASLNPASRNPGREGDASSNLAASSPSLPLGFVPPDNVPPPPPNEPPGDSSQPRPNGPVSEEP